MSSGTDLLPSLTRRAAVSTALTALLLRPVSAQQAPPRDTVVELDSLAVTILRAPSRRAHVPYAVDVADESELRLGKTGAFLEEALEGLPGVQVQNRFNYAVGERLAIRGFGSRAQFGIRGVKVLVDGIPATMPDGQSSLDHLDLATLGRVEVLRGPGSALYGNAAGGVLSFRTRAPWTGDLREEVRGVAGSHGLLDVDAVTSGTLGGTGYVAGVGRLSWDGFRADPTREGQTYGAADRIHFNGQLTRPLGGGRLRLTLNAMDLNAENPGSVAAADLGSSPTARAYNVLQHTGKDLTQRQAGASWEGPAPGGTADVALWAIGRSVLNPIPTDIIDLDRLAGGVRALLYGEQRSGAGPLRWSSGVEVEMQSDDRRNFTNDGGEATALSLDQKERVGSAGAFGRLALGLPANLELSASLRYDRVRFEVDDRLVGGGNPDDSGERTLDAWSPSVGLLAEASPEFSVWANISTSLETPTTTELVNRPDGGGGFNPALDAQHTTGLEAGARGRLAARLDWEITLFRADITGELVPFEVPGQTGRTFFRNAGESRHSGVEVVLDADLGAGLSTRATWTRVDARYETFEVDGADLSGNRIPGLAPNRVQGLLTQERPRWFWAIEADWSDRVPVDDAGTASADAYALLDLRAGIRELALGDLRLAPFGGIANAFDESYVAAVTVNAFGGRFYEPGPGRSFHVGATVTWARR